ncbi:MAG: carbon starvation protein A [Vicinamibacterales bacterium]
MHALYLVIPALLVLAIAYRYYSAFLAAKVMMLDDTRVTPAHSKNDGSNYFPTSRWVLFGHHFAGITGAGPLLGPVLAMQFGYAPGIIWLLAGVCLAGAVHDMLILWASTRRGGRSLADMARTEIGPVAGATAVIAILFILIIALAGLGIAMLNALAESSWGIFTIGATIPIAVLMGFHMFVWRKGKIQEATVIGVGLMLLAVIFGKNVADSSWGHYLVLTPHQITLALGVYVMAASVMPVWMLLTPRSYLSTFMKIGVIVLLAIGVIIVNPEIHMPAFGQWNMGGGPILGGPLYPFLFITIMCGSISGFHALIGSGTTSKLVDKESDIRPVGYAAMLFEGLVGIMALIAASTLHPGDFYAMNATPAVYETLGLSVVHLPDLAAQVGENVVGRTGGAVSLAIGMADVFSKLPGMSALVSYWYHFAVMFEALFILTTIDSGTRVGRFLLQETIGRAWPKFADTKWMPASLTASALIVLPFCYFIWTGNIATIWPMFGIANQLLAAVALAIGTTVIINEGRKNYAWVTMAPLVFVTVTTLSAGYLSIKDNYWPKAMSGDPALVTIGWVDSVCTAIMMACAIIILVAAARKWMRTFSQGPAPVLQTAS